MNYNITAQQVAAVMAMIDGEDDKLREDMIEGETDLHEFASRILYWIEEDEGIINALSDQIDDRKIRQDRAKARIAARRDMIMALMDMAKLEKLALPEATISKRDVAPKLIFPNVEAVPDEYCKFDRNLDREKLKSVDPDSPPSWAAMDNGGQSITIRRK